MTYDELIHLASCGDPLIDPTLPLPYELTDKGLIIYGRPGEGGTDLLVRLDAELGIIGSIRDTQGANYFLGTEWVHETTFDDYDALCIWAYSW